MDDFEKGKRKKRRGPDTGPKKGLEVKRPDDADLSDEDKEILAKDKELAKELYMEKVRKSIEDKEELLEKIRSGKDTKKPEKTEEEIELEKMNNEYKRLVTQAKIDQLREKLEKAKAPPREKTPEELEYENLVKEYNRQKLLAEKDLISKKIEEMANARKPKEKSELEKEYDALKKELEKIQEIHKIEDMKAKIAEAREKVQDKAKYLKDKKGASGGSWFSFLNPFRTDTSKHVSIGATLAIGLLCGALPLLLVGGLMALIPSDETKAKKAKA